MKFLPDVTWPPASVDTAGLASRETINSTASTANKQNMTLVSQGSPLRIVLGRDRIGADVINVISHNGYLVVQAIWAYAPGTTGIQAINSVTFNDETVPASVLQTHYLGATGQGVDPWLAAAFTAAGKTYTDTLPNIAYSVFKLPESVVADMNLPNISAIIDGVKVYDPRENLFLQSAPVDTNSYWLKGANTTRVGTTTGPRTGSVATVYSSSNSTSSYVASLTMNWDANQTYTVSVAARLVSGTVPTSGSLIIVAMDNDNNTGDIEYAYITFSGLTSEWKRFSVTFTNVAAYTGRVYFISDYGNGAQIALADANLNRGTDAVFNPTTSTNLLAGTRHTSTPSVLLGAFINQPWGMNQDINWSTVMTCANLDDGLVGGKPRRTLGVTIDKVQATNQWLETLRTYASCWVVPGNEGAELIPDAPTATSLVLTHSNGDIKEVTSFEIRDIANTPNVVRANYTDTTSIPWRRDVFAEAALPEVLTGTPRRESVVNLEGFHDYSEALRAAIERLNKLTLSDLTATVVLFDERVDVKVGDVIELTTDFGITNKLFRVITVAHSYGDCTLGLSEYDPASYSDAVGTQPTYTDISLPSPNNPPTVTGLTTVEELYELRDGTIASRLAISWSAPQFLWLDSYYVEVYDGPSLLWSGTSLTNSYRTGAVKDNVSLTINVVTVSRSGVVSEPATTVVTTLGKFALPSDVPYIRGYEVGGEVRLELGPAIDKDLRGLEVRYGVVGTSWESAKFVDFVPTAPGVGARILSKIIPAGTWDVLCCALDSVEQYSVTPARMTITVTSDASAFLADSHAFTNPYLSNMAEFRLGRTDVTRRFVSEDNVMFGTKFSNTLSTYTNALASYCSVDSAITTESWDFGLQLSGDWTGTATYIDLAGTADLSVRLSATSITGPWTTYTPASARTTARYGHLVIVATAGEAFYYEVPNTELRINAVPRTEYSKSPATSSASTYTRITLENDYVALKGPPKITVLGTSAASCTVDNIQTGNPTTFDVYIFSSAGVQVARDFMWEFNGV